MSPVLGTIVTSRIGTPSTTPATACPASWYAVAAMGHSRRESPTGGWPEVRFGAESLFVLPVLLSWDFGCDLI